MECSNCGVSDRNARLFDVISGEGIVKLCQECLSSDNVPLNRAGGVPPGKEKKQTTYERLSMIAGLDAEKHKRNIFGKDKTENLKKQEVTLRDLVDKKFDKFVKEEVKKRDDLVENFHWVIMRARRHRKMSVSQLAREIGEAEKVVKMAEQGILPEGYDVVIKLENVLGVNLLRPGVTEMLEEQPKRLGFDKATTRVLTISDLHEMKKTNPDLNIDDLEGFELEGGRIDSGTTGFGAKKRMPYWRTALAKIMNKRKKEENEIIVREIGKAKEAEDEIKEKEPEGFEKEAELEDSLGRDSQEVEYDDTSLQMTTRFPGQREVSEAEEAEEAAKAVGKKENEMSQKEIDDLIFGRKE